MDVYVICCPSDETNNSIFKQTVPTGVVETSIAQALFYFTYFYS